VANRTFFASEKKQLSVANGSFFFKHSLQILQKDPKGGEIRHRHQAVTGESEVEAPLLQIRTSVVLEKCCDFPPQKNRFFWSFFLVRRENPF